jgi:predicted amidohydrolase
VSSAPAEVGRGAREDAGSLRVACVQMNSRGDVADNVRVAVELVESAAARGARLVVLPETWAFKGPREGILAYAEPVDGPSNAALAAVAARRGVWVLAGSIYEPSPAPELVFNTSALLGPDGSVHAVYRKIHLFDVTSGTVAYHESQEVSAGSALVTADLEVAGGSIWSLGLTICYDLRFPELYRSLALRGAEVLCAPAAFTAHTGAAHWEVLVRARAVENTCFVLAPNQVGEHLPDRACHGHSVIVDPWGEILAEVDDEVGICVADLDRARLAEVRAQIPSLQNRRPDTYDL